MNTSSSEYKLTLTIEKLKEAMDKIAFVPKPEIKAIVITRIISSGIYKIKYEDGDYLLVHPVDWQQILSKIPPISDSLISFGRLGQFGGIPVFEDDELAKKILSYAIKPYVPERPSFSIYSGCKS